MAAGEQEGKAWLRIMRTQNAGMKVEIMFFSTLGKREGSDPRGESLRKNFVPGLRYVKKNKSADLLTCRQISNLLIFPAKTKNQQIDRQADDRFHFPGHSTTVLNVVLVQQKGGQH